MINILTNFLLNPPIYCCFLTTNPTFGWILVNTFGPGSDTFPPPDDATPNIPPNLVLDANGGRHSCLLGGRGTVARENCTYCRPKLLPHLQVIFVNRALGFVAVFQPKYFVISTFRNDSNRSDKLISEIFLEISARRYALRSWLGVFCIRCVVTKFYNHVRSLLPEVRGFPPDFPCTAALCCPFTHLLYLIWTHHPSSCLPCAFRE